MTSSSKDSEFENQPEPEFQWQTSGGKTVGIWGLEWADLIMKAFANKYPQYHCEVWQPDIRADKIYTAQLCETLVHRNFPAILKSRLIGLHMTKETNSELYRELISEYDDQDTLFIAPVGTYKLWLKPPIVSLKKSPILYITLLNSAMILPDRGSYPNPIKNLIRWRTNKQKIKWMKGIKNFIVQNDNPQAIKEAKRLYPNMRVFSFQMGLDLDFWKPIISKEEARLKLSLPSDKFVIVLSQRLVPEYQIDKFIGVITKVKTNKEFVCYVTGHGADVYEQYLFSMVDRLNTANKIKFVGFVTDEELRTYFIAADLFATLPKFFAGSGGAQKCIALGTPILHITSGCTYELLKEYGAGEYVDPYDYSSWVSKLEQIIDGKPVKTMTRQMAEESLSWKKTAEDIHHAIQNLQ
jgi:glycosyltransferase involved in cell wall biosynthesis